MKWANGVSSEYRFKSVSVCVCIKIYEAKFIIELELFFFVVNILSVGFSQAPGTQTILNITYVVW